MWLCGPHPAAVAQAEQPVAAVPRIALIIDDLGYNLAYGQRAVNLPGAVTCSILPGTPHAHKLAQHAKESGKEIMLHLPMQGSVHSATEPGSLSPEMTEPDFRAILQQHLAALPEAVGVNNHMGSRVTPLPEQMNWLMDELAQHSLYFVDSRTTHLTVAAHAAAEHAVAFMQRDVFLDNEKNYAFIEAAFESLIQKAQRRGYAIGIAHAHPATLAALENLLPQLQERGIRLQSVSQLVTRTQAEVAVRTSIPGEAVIQP
ncbi:MAG TPA: divergent polysaccharide deacetylase family protein [Gammaproteobacteria bacterium]